MTCNCNGIVEKSNNSTKEMIYLFCKSCPAKGAGKTELEALENLRASAPPAQNTQLAPVVLPLSIPIDLPKNPAQLAHYIEQQKSNIMKTVAPSMRNDTPAITTMIERNIEYLFRLDCNKAWGNKEGQEAIVNALKDSFIYGATLPDMGYIVPFKNTVQLILSKEAYIHALTGDGAPFDWIHYDVIYENDKPVFSKKDGVFSIDVNPALPRGQAVGVAVYGWSKKHKKQIGELYDRERLLEKAISHSTSYRQFMNDMEEIKILRQEGKLKSKNGREYIEKGSKNGPWEKWVDGITNPYAGGDLPEMLLKLAIKSWLSPWLKSLGSYKADAEMHGVDERTLLQKVDDTIANANKYITGDDYGS